jgi:hypothetical protein
MNGHLNSYNTQKAMKTHIKRVSIWLGLSILMMIFWIIGIVIGNTIFPSNLMDQASESDNNVWLFLLVCSLNTLIILYFIYNARYKGWKLAGILFFVTFGIQYFMSQIETIWFNDSLKLSMNGILAIVSGGAIMALLFSPTSAWLTGNFRPFDQSLSGKVKWDLLRYAKQIVLLSVIVWPLIYFLAGYLIAWQFTDVRMFYSGTGEIASFGSIMKDNFISGLYFFQIFRGFMWILIGLLVLMATEGSWINKGTILGLLFAILGSSGLLLPNPVMPFMVRMAHFIETFPSSFIWGLIIAWSFREFTIREVTQSDSKIPLPEEVA